MKKKREWSILMAVLATAMLMLTACSDGSDDDIKDLRSQISVGEYKLYNGEWSVNGEVIDTVQLIEEKKEQIFIVILPERYLTVCCFGEELASSGHEYKRDRVVIMTSNQGYTNETMFNVIKSTQKSYNGTQYFCHASFVVGIDGVKYRIDLLSQEQGYAVYNGLWSIGIPISILLVTNTETQEERGCPLPEPITLYYNATELIIDKTRQVK